MWKSKFVIFALFIIGLNTANAEAVGVFELKGVGADDLAAAKKLLSEIDARLPDKVKQLLTRQVTAKGFEGSNNIVVEFADFSTEIAPPLCDVVGSMAKAEQAKYEFAQVSSLNKSAKGIRYEGQVHTMVVPQKNSSPYDLKIVLNRAFLPVVKKGEAAASKFNCGHKNTYRLAQGALLNGVARILDASRFENSLELRANGKDGVCTQKEKMMSTVVDCEDMKGSSTLISERARYKNLTFGWQAKGMFDSKLESAMAYWPRAVSRFEYAGRVQDQFAFNFEFFMLDPEFQCRKPLLNAYLSKRLGTKAAPFKPSFAGAQACSVNTKIFVNMASMRPDGSVYINPGEEDISPDRVAEVNYYRASVGAAAMSMMGHAMFRLVLCPPGEKANDAGDCSRINSYDLIINPRANPQEMRMDNIKGVFGGYPSQFLISRFEDIYQEYGQGELRHLFNFPMGATDSSGKFTPMKRAEREDFLYSTLEAYWSYVGDYKFISNNCADETMRLYKMASPDSRFANTSVLTPKGMSKVMAANGAIDESRFEKIKEPNLFAKIPGIGKWFWSADDKKEQREEIENNQDVDQSFLYLTRDSIADIYKREHGGATAGPDQIDKEMKAWSKLATISKKSGALCKNNEKYATEQARLARVNEQMKEVMQRYNKLYDAAKARFQAGDEQGFKDMNEISRSFYAIVDYLVQKRRKDLSDLIIEVAYEIISPDNGKKTICGKEAWNEIREKQRSDITDLLRTYEATSDNIQPFSSLNLVQGGYGIPLKGELKALDLNLRHEIELEIAKQRGAVRGLLRIVGPDLGLDYGLYVKMEGAASDLLVDRCNDKLPVGMLNKDVCMNQR